MRRVPIRLKLAAALSIPLLALTLVTLLEVAQAAREVDETNEQADLASAAIGPSGLITALQNERTWASIDLIGVGDIIEGPVEGYDQTRADTDAALTAFTERILAIGGDVEAAYMPGVALVEEQIAGIRADIDENVAANPDRSVDNNRDFSNPTFHRYTDLITPFLEATTRVALAVNDAELRQGTQLAGTATRQIETLSLMASEVLGSLTTGGVQTSEQIAAAATLLDDFERNAAAMRNGTGVYADIAARTFPEELTDDIVANVDRAIDGEDIDTNVFLQTFDLPADQRYEVYQQAVADRTEARAAELTDAAHTRQLWFGVLAFVVLATAVTLTVLVSRSITRPLRSLTRQAKDMADRRLPDAVIDILETPLGEDIRVPSVEPVTVRTRDEVDDVSTALNTVQDTALDLAVEQAVLRRNIADSFVNLGRRNQNLLGRQLDFITELESRETDADTLADLFRLDHLATRMRRNAESLLVLAGIEPPRQWAAPVRLTDVIRAALGEVEDYQRVTVRGVEPATIVGSAAADLAHLLAELIENALHFSPPDQTVDIRGRAGATGHGGQPDGYTLVVIDSGLGMAPQDVAAANRRLAGAESFTIAPSKYLGHYVAGNLAARHDIQVSLDNGPQGITAVVGLPSSLLTTEHALPPADEPHAARDVWPPAPVTGPTTGELPTATGPAPTPPPPSSPTSPFGSGPAPFGSGPAPASPAMSPFGSAPAPPSPATSPFGSGAAARQPVDPDPLGVPPVVGPGPAGVPPSAPGPVGPAPRQPAADAGPGRTPSGLVRRTPRIVDTGEVPAVGAVPDDSLLASLDRVASRRTQPPATDGPSGPGEPPDPRRPAGVPPGGLAAGLSGLAPFDPRTSPGGPGGTTSEGLARGGTTSTGLTRRVRGAQMPNAHPLSLRRSGAAPGTTPTPGPGAGPAPGPAPTATPAPPSTPGSSPPSTPSRTVEHRQSAEDVYSFLTNFTAGVHRGLGEARNPRHGRG